MQTLSPARMRPGVGRESALAEMCGPSVRLGSAVCLTSVELTSAVLLQTLQVEKMPIRSTVLSSELKETIPSLLPAKFEEFKASLSRLSITRI